MHTPAARTLTTRQLPATLTYDTENHLTSVSGGASASFVYDGDGNRVKATFGGSTIAYVGDYFEWKGSTNDMVKYYYANGQRIAMRVGSNTPYYLLTDHLGSTAITADSSGTRVAELRYYAYGGTRYTYGTTPTAYKFTDQRLDESTGLMYYGARYYDPALGRFVQADTIVPEPGNPQALNRYSYVLNNPLRYTDPTGQRIAVYDEYANSLTEPPLPPPPPTYDPGESVRQAWGLVWDWFWEAGPEVRYFGPESSLTQDITYDRGMIEFRKEWAAAGYQLPFTYRDTADEREEGPFPIRFVKGSLVYVREHLFELPVATVGLGSTTPEGQIDPVGGTVGSLDRIRVYDAGNGTVMFEVYNRMDWRSALRIPGLEGIIPSYRRDQVPLGGALEMYFIWYEPMPQPE